MAIVNQYHSTVPSMRYVFRSGVLGHFTGGKFRTTDADQIAELDKEIKLGHPFIYTRPETKVIDTANDDPMIGLKKKWLEEYLAEQKKTAANIDAGDADYGKTDTTVKAANSNTTQAAIAGKKVQANPIEVKAMLPNN